MPPLLAGVLIAVICGTVGHLLASQLWRVRLNSLEAELSSLRLLRQEENSVAGALNELRTGVERLSAEVARQREDEAAMKEALESLDRNVFKLIQLQTGAVTLASPGGAIPTGWNPNAEGGRNSLPPRDDFPNVLSEPT